MPPYRRLDVLGGLLLFADVHEVVPRFNVDRRHVEMRRHTDYAASSVRTVYATMNTVQTVLPRPRHPLRSQPVWKQSQSVGDSRSRSGLRSSSTSSMDYSLPRLRTKFGKRAFSHAGPTTWNALPDHFRTVADPVQFRKLLKSHYFSQAFNIC